MMTIEDRIRGLEARIESSRAEARSCVRELLIDDGARYLVAERLPSLGSVIIPAIRELIDERTTPDEVRTMAAIVGVQVGDYEQSVQVLLDELEHRGEFAPLAARRLAATGLSSAGAGVEQALHHTHVCDIDSVVTYLEAMSRLERHLTPEERYRLEAADKWQITSALAEWHPLPPGEG